MSYYQYKSYPRKRRRYYTRSQYGIEDILPRFITLILIFPLLAIIPYYLKFIEYIFQHPNIAIGLGVAIFVIYGLISFFLIRYKREIERKRLLGYSRYKEILKINWREFEKYVEAILREDNFETKLGPGTNDGGVDIFAEKDNRKYLIQCKHYGNEQKVTVQQVREFYGVMNHLDSTAKGIYVTTGELTNEAIEFCRQEDIEVWDKKYFLNFFKENTPQLQYKVEDSGICEKCGGKLIIRTAKNGPNKGHQFLGCENYPNCTFIKNI